LLFFNNSLALFHLSFPLIAGCAFKELITLPIHLNLTDEDCLKVTNTLKEVLKIWE